METPLVTIVIPVFNSEEYLEETLQTVADQVYPQWECILVDDGSSDRSEHIAQTFSEKDTRFKWFQRDRKPKGVSVCRNIGIEASKGEYLIFLDSDDLLHKDCLSKRVAYMEEHPELDFAVFQMQAFGRKRFSVTEPSDDYLKSFLSFEFPWVVTSPIWRRHFLKKLNGFNEKLPVLEDPELHMRALIEDPHFVVLADSEPDCYYRQYKVYGLKKDTKYWNFIRGYATFFDESDIFSKLNGEQLKWLKSGFYRMILHSTAPFETEDYHIYSKAAIALRRNKVIGPVTSMTSIMMIRLLRICPHHQPEKMIKFIWGFTIRPGKFLRELVIPKLLRQ